jgi:Tfp pilus assembly protein PilO
MATETRKGALVGVLATALIAILGWALTVEGRLSAFEAQTTQSSERAQRVERDAEASRVYMQSIDQRLARIEGKLDRR